MIQYDICKKTRLEHLESTTQELIHTALMEAQWEIEKLADGITIWMYNEDMEKYLFASWRSPEDIHILACITAEDVAEARVIANAIINHKKNRGLL